jgi:dienelactone hydrolase
MNCGRYSSFSIAERLASHGVVVVAPDHAGPGPYLDGALGEQLSPAQLDTRVADVTAVLDAALDGDLFAGRTELEGMTIDPDRIGMMGHSFGSVTTGVVAQNDDRISAAVGLAAPMANPLFPGVEMADIHVPVFLVLAEEDNSIMEVGNRFIRENFEDANSPVWRVDWKDTGHWSVSDLVGINDAFSAGCGEGVRHSEGREGETFTYREPRYVRGATSSMVAVFFLATLDEHHDATLILGDLSTLFGEFVYSR